MRGPVLAEVLQGVLGSSRSSSSGGSGSSSSGGSGSTGVANGYMVSVLCRLLVEFDRDVNKGLDQNTINGSDKGSDPLLLGQYLDTTLSRLQMDPVKHTDKFLTG